MIGEPAIYGSEWRMDANEVSINGLAFREAMVHYGSHSTLWFKADRFSLNWLNYPQGPRYVEHCDWGRSTSSWPLHHGMWGLNLGVLHNMDLSLIMIGNPPFVNWVMTFHPAIMAYRRICLVLAGTSLVPQLGQEFSPGMIFWWQVVDVDGYRIISYSYLDIWMMPIDANCRAVKNG